MLPRPDDMPDFPENEYRGFVRYDFIIEGCPVTVVVPHAAAPGRRWIWRAEFFDAFPAFDLAMLAQGWYLVYMSVGNTFGCPSAMARFNTLYRELIGTYAFHPRPVLEGLSRGGLYVYNWAAANPEKVGAIYGDNPVCDFKSWPGGKGRGPGSQADWQALMRCYGFSSEIEAMTYRKNPVDNLEPIANAGIPLIHVCGDADESVPWEENTKILAERYKKLGGNIEIILKPGGKHHPHGLENPGPVVDWVLKHSIP